MSTLFRLAAVAAIALLAACASGGSFDAADAPTVLPQADPVASVVGRPEYRIGPSDLLSVTIFQIKDLDREVRVNNAGNVSLPLIGAVDVAGRTVSQLEREIADRYTERFLQDPQVTVFVKEYASQRVTVGGAVDKPGIYPITSKMTLLQSIAMAGGMEEVASHRNVLVFRTAGGERRYARFDVAAIEAGQQADPELAGEDVVVVDTSSGKVTLQNLIRLAPFVAVWRAYR